MKTYRVYCLVGENKREARQDVDCESREQAIEKINNTIRGSHSFRVYEVTLEVGTVLSNSWGYDQTNVDFYQIVGFTKSGKSVYIRPIASEVIEESANYSGRVAPVKDEFIGSKVTKRLRSYGVDFEHGGCRIMCDGETERFSSYA